MFYFRTRPIHGQQRLVAFLLLHLLLVLQPELEETFFHSVHHTLTSVYAEAAHLLHG